MKPLVPACGAGLLAVLSATVFGQSGIGVLGPHDFVRDSGRPRVDQWVFDAAPGGYTICVANGGLQDQYRLVTSAEIGLNGAAVFQPRHFRSTAPDGPRPPAGQEFVRSLSMDVTLGAENVLTVSVASEPGAGLTIWLAEGHGVPCVAAGANRPPVANAGPDQEVTLGDVVQLDGSGSTDPDDDPLSFSWVLTARPGGSTVELTDADTDTPSFQPDVGGEYVAELTVHDGRGGSATDTVTITVLSGVNNPPTITSQPITVALHLEEYTYQVAASDPDNDPLTFALNTAPEGMTIDAATGLVSWTPPGTGVLDAEVSVADGHGGIAT